LKTLELVRAYSVPIRDDRVRGLINGMSRLPRML